MLPSGNDAAVAIAQHVGGRILSMSIAAHRFDSPVFEDGAQGSATADASAAVGGTSPPEPDACDRALAKRAFVDAMNVVASSLRCHGTSFVNPHGMDARPRISHRSTPLDVARTAIAAAQHPLLAQVMACRSKSARLRRRRTSSAPVSGAPPSLPTASRCASEMSSCGTSVSSIGSSGDASVSGGRPDLAAPAPDASRLVVWTNTHSLVQSDSIPSVSMGKTGVTPGAGPCLSSIADVGGRRFAIVVLGATSREGRYSDTLSLIRWVRRTVKRREKAQASPSCPRRAARRAAGRAALAGLPTGATRIKGAPLSSKGSAGVCCAQGARSAVSVRPDSFVGRRHSPRLSPRLSPRPSPRLSPRPSPRAAHGRGSPREQGRAKMVQGRGLLPLRI